MNNPIQPLYKDECGVVRFKANAIVRFLLDAGPIDLNKLAVMEFSADDRMQFAQLIGYSLSGFGELGYVLDDVYAAAEHMSEQSTTEEQARIATLSEVLNDLRAALREPMAQLFGVHPDDLAH